MLAPVEYTRPETIAEAVAALGEGSGARPLAGGQALLNVLKHREVEVDVLVDISRLEELRFIDITPSGSAELGAGVA